MKNKASNQKKLQIKQLSFTYQNDILDFADWYDEDKCKQDAEKNGKTNIKDISFSVNPGELILITGESGCGKTTLLRIINGIIPEFYYGKIEGDVLYDNKSILHFPVDKRGIITGSVFQNPRSQFFNVFVKDELRFGCENINLSVDEIEKRTTDIIDAFHLDSILDKNLFHLSGGEKQKVACLSVAAMKPPIMLYDEPSSNLDDKGMQFLQDLMTRFKQAGIIQVVAEHRLSYISELVDFVIFMKDGQIIETFTGEELRFLTDEQLKQKGLRNTKFLSSININNQININFKDQHFKSIRNYSSKDLYIESLEMRYKISSKPFIKIKNYCFKGNHIHALIANNGVGKSTFLRCLAGLENKAKGFIKFKDKRYKLKDMVNLCSMVFQDVNRQLLCGSVYEELLLSLQNSQLTPLEKEEKILSLTKKLNLDNLLSAHPFSLSGGQKQRLAFASAVLTDREILILDEPTSGLDLKHMNSIAEILIQYAENHIVLLATHDQELLKMLQPETHKLID